MLIPGVGAALSARATDERVADGESTITGEVEDNTKKGEPDEPTFSSENTEPGQSPIQMQPFGGMGTFSTYYSLSELEENTALVPNFFFVPHDTSVNPDTSYQVDMYLTYNPHENHFHES